jgi:hypothetical protein
MINMQSNANAPHQARRDSGVVHVCRNKHRGTRLEIGRDGGMEEIQLTANSMNHVTSAKA